MMKSIYFLPVLLLMMVACSGGSGDPDPDQAPIQDTAVQSVEIEVEHNIILAADGTTKTQAKLGIEGMMCSVGCAGKIKQALGTMSGVKFCDVDFDKKTASVEYEPDSLTAEEMIAAIQSLNKGQYAVTSAEVLSYQPQ